VRELKTLIGCGACCVCLICDSSRHMQKDLLQRGKRRMEKREMGNGGPVRKVAAVCFPAQKQSQSEKQPKSNPFSARHTHNQPANRTQTESAANALNYLKYLTLWRRGSVALFVGLTVAHTLAHTHTLTVGIFHCCHSIRWRHTLRMSDILITLFDC